MRGVYVNMLVGNKHQHSQVIEKNNEEKKTTKKLQIYKTRLAYLFKVFSSFISLVVKHSFLYDLAPAFMSFMSAVCKTCRHASWDAAMYQF